MRPILLVALLLAVIPIANGLASPVDAYVGVDPLGGLYSYSLPYEPSTAISCTIPMTLQVQRNAGGGWDVLVRSTASAPSPFDPLNTGGLATSAQSCPFQFGGALTFTNVPGSPSAGLQKIVSSSCHRDWLYVSPFTLGGPAGFSWSIEYYPSCYGPSAFAYGYHASPAAMG